jgi:DNA-binding MarR family transcriptional regulator
VSDEPGIPVTGLVWRLSMRWRSAIDREIGDLGLTHAQYAVLAPLLSLHRAGQRPSQRQLADASGLESLYVSKLARGLESAGLVARTTDPGDARAVQLTLTDHGRQVTATAMDRVRRLQEELLAPLGGTADPRVVTLVENLNTLLTNGG